jgi:hypothetical protein
MGNQTEFEVADRDAGVSGELVTVEKDPRGALQPTNIAEYRAQLIAKYHKGARGLIERLRTSGQDNAEALLLAIIEEVVRETDYLSGIL